MTHCSTIIHGAHRVMFSFMICLQTSHQNELENKQFWKSIIKTPRLTSLLMMMGRMWVKRNLSHYLTLVACWEFPNRILLRDPRIAQHNFPSNQPLTRGLGNTWLLKIVQWENYQPVSDFFMSEVLIFIAALFSKQSKVKSLWVFKKWQ